MHDDADTSPTQVYALVPCAGHGERAGPGGPKQYREVAGRSVVAHTLAALKQVCRLAATLVVLSPNDQAFARHAPDTQAWIAAVGGMSRAASVRAGLAELARRGARRHDWVLVHDAARCLVRPIDIDRLIDACLDDEVGGLLALPVADTLKRASGEGNARVASTIDRREAWQAQTPQMFRLGLLQRALEAAGDAATDEASAVEALGLAPRLVPGRIDNFKLTWPDDFALAERLLRSAPCEHAPFRIGEGWDTHALVTGRKLILGGVEIPHTHGLLGHSDADALLHAITDALLGAAALGDIGRHFPDTDERFRGADSSTLLQEAMGRVRAAGWTLGNLDATIVAQAPKMAPHIPAMVRSIAASLVCSESQINVKAKTAEKMGPVGRGEAIEARAVVLLVAVVHEGGG